MTNQEKDKQYQFVKLCSDLTKQGFQFTRGENYTLIFPQPLRFVHIIDRHFPFTKSWKALKFDRKYTIMQPVQWADKV